MESIVVKARAKINPALDILGKRSDGYHELLTVMQTIELHDTLHIQKTESCSLRLECDHADLPTDERNLAYAVAQYLIREFGIRQGVHIRIEKKIPVAAGLAGGSSDCAAVIRGLNTLFALQISRSQMMEIGRHFGADVPFCLMRGSALAEGVGEKLTRLPPHPAVWVVLACPNVVISTKDVFDQYDPVNVHIRPNIKAMTNAFDRQDLSGIAAAFGNVLESVTAKQHPVIDALINTMHQTGALNAGMSGSGPTVFGYYENKETAQSAVHIIEDKKWPVLRETRVQDSPYPSCDVYLTGIYNYEPLKGAIHEDF